MSDDDLSALRRRLERAEKWAIAGELAAQIAHEIKNPLAPIRGYAQLLSEKLDSVKEGERALFARGLSVIREETERIERRVLRLLARARIDDRQCAIAAGSGLELSQAVEDTIALARGEGGAVQIAYQPPGRPVRVLGDEDDVRGAVFNVIRNAMEAKAQRIEIGLRIEDDKVTAEILDDGSGLGEEEAARAFEAFFSTKANGTGLGLAIVRQVIEAAGGEVEIAPRADVRGARVTMTFVRADRP